jgi:hypothetical protein
MKKLIVFSFVLFSFYACNTNNSSENDVVSIEENTSKTNNQYCYLNTLEGQPIKIDGKIVQEMIDSTILRFTIENNQVRGIYNYLPAEQDRKIGSFVGDIVKGGKISGLYTFTQEGEQYKEGITIQMEEDKAIVNIAELVIPEKGGKVTFNLQEETITIKKVDCN